MIIKDTCNGIDIEIDTNKFLISISDKAVTGETLNETTFHFNTWNGLKAQIDHMIDISGKLK